MAVQRSPQPSELCILELAPVAGWLSSAIAPSSSPSYTGCVQESGFNFNGAISTRNQIAASGYTYDGAGNLITAPPTGTTYAYDAENHLISTGGVTYTYDGDGKRVTKSSGTIYSYLPSGEVLMESSLSTGYEQFLYFYFNGQRVANTNNLNAPGEFAWYFTDHLGSTRFYWQWDGDGGSNRSDYYPFGGERVLQSDEPSHYKFTGKERDSESGNDNFGARFYSSSLGRFMSPDWSEAPDPVPYAELESPQSLNLYSYVRNNSLNRTDFDGHATRLVCSGETESKDGIIRQVVKCHEETYLDVKPSFAMALLARVGGHHLMPQAISKVMSLTPAARNFFQKQFVTGRLTARHGWSRAHALYNNAISRMGRVQGAIEREEVVDLEEAKDIGARILGSTEEEIAGFIDALPPTASGMSSREALTRALFEGDLDAGADLLGALAQRLAALAEEDPFIDF